MSFFGLSLAGKALAAFQQAANTTSDNIGNINTPGASRQVVNLTEAPPIAGSPFYTTHFGPGTRGDGTIVDSITRIHQDSYDALFRGASSAQNYFDIQQQQLGATQQAFAEPNNGINKAYTELQTAISQLASQPTSTPTRANVISKSQALVDAFNQTGQSLQQQESLVSQQAGSVVTKANDYIDKIAALNGQIRASKAVGDNPNTYQDQRDYLIDQLSQLLSTQTSIQANGSTLVTVGGRALVNDTVAYHLAPPVIGSNPNGTVAFKIGFANDKNPANPQAIPLGSGQLAAYADLYNNKFVPYGQKLDAFANAVAVEINRVTQASLDLNGNPGLALLQPVVLQSAISASNIKVGITDPSMIPAGLISTSAGTLTRSINSANNTINTAANINGNATFFNPAPPAGLAGNLRITVDGITQTFTYATAGATPNASTVDQFISSFNNGKFGVTAGYDTIGQKIVFSRDPSNIDLVHRALQGATPPTPAFTILDSNAPTAGAGQGANATSLLQALGAAAIQGVPQTALNAYGSSGNGGANALLKVFTQNAGIGSLQTTAGAIVTGTFPGPVQIQEPTPGAYGTVLIGQVLTVDAGSAAQENVVVTAINRTTGTITATFANPHGPGFSIASAQQQTLGAYYGGLVGQIGLDAQSAITGTQTQTTLAKNIDKVRQGIDGINLDEETQNLIKFQNAYAAAAKTINVLDQMLQTVLGLGGR